MKPKLYISVGAETSDEECNAIQEVFEEQFDVEISKSIGRFSNELFPLLIHLGWWVINWVVPNLAWDYLKFKVKQIFAQTGQGVRANKIIKFRSDEMEVWIKENNVTVFLDKQILNFESIDEAVEMLKNHFESNPGGDDFSE